MTCEFDDINQAKEDFTDIYNQPDPREYFTTLGALDYRIPDEARPVFETLLDAMAGHGGPGGAAPTVLDLGCSYGINAAVLKYDLTFQELRQRYTEDQFQDLNPILLAASDRAFLSERAVARDLPVIGLDVAPRAIGYARTVGLLDEGVIADLESQPLRPLEAEVVRPANLIISTGCVGYVGERTFEQIVDSMNGDPPWVASFVLRMFPYEPIADALAARGFVTEKLHGRTFRQRRFADEAEREKIFGQLEGNGRDPAGIETDGYLHAEFFLTRPAEAVRALPLDRLFSAGSA